MQCREFNEIIDSYLKNELLVETNHDVIRHLEDCPACRRELAARREMRAQLQRAFASNSEFGVRPEFAFQLRNKLKEQALGKSRTSFNPFVFAMRSPQWLAAAACLIVAAIAGVIVWHGRGSTTDAGQISSVENRSNIPQSENNRAGENRDLRGAAIHLASFEVKERAVGDHQNCAIKYHLTEDPITLEEAGRRYDSADTKLGAVVRLAAALRAGDIKYVEDHSCVYQNQRFAHVILKHKGHTVSLLVALNETEAQGTNDDVIACSSMNGYQVSCLETKRHTIFVVSDLSEADNLALARSLAPDVSKHIRQAEA